MLDNAKDFFIALYKDNKLACITLIACIAVSIAMMIVLAMHEPIAITAFLLAFGAIWTYTHMKGKDDEN